VVWIYVKLPTFNRLRSEGKERQLAAQFAGRVRLTLVTYTLVAVAAVIGAPELLKLIGAKTALLPTGMFALLLFIQLLETHHAQYSVLVLTENRNPFLKPAVFSGLGVLVFSLAATPIWGIWGLLLSQGIVQACYNNWWPILRAIEGLKISKKDYFALFFSLRSPKPDPA
jgi:hypothetical protein